ncbi:hypothetical protein [uncultured Ramlibacter sp.]|uniref:hypothetical protein n=1 Tax=uncultured Ramlibacter sp. TaxID=260755 RepID=UPI0026283ED3|nr:hypothetical protein [uncultured Ramlibacter sp.]
MSVILIVLIGWLYVALMMAVTEATSTTGSLLGALITFVLYGVGPVALLVYLMLTPARKRLRREREAREAAQWASQQQAAPSGQPDADGEAPTDPVTPVRKEP